jgi:hypothetical protein
MEAVPYNIEATLEKAVFSLELYWKIDYFCPFIQAAEATGWKLHYRSCIFPGAILDK